MAAKRKDHRFFPALLVCLFFVATIFYFAPLEVLLGNENDFLFPIKHVWWMQLIAVCAASLVLTGLCCLLPKKPRTIVLAVLTGLGLGAWAQANLLNGLMTSQETQAMVVTGGQKALNLAVWCVILAAAVVFAVIMIRKRKGRIARSIFAGVCAAVLAMQTIGFTTTMLTKEHADKAAVISIKAEGQFALAPKDNVIVFIIDSVDNELMHRTLDKYPEISEIMSGFTWYENATSMYSRTYPSLTYMLTQAKWDPTIPAADYVDNAYKNSTFLPALHNAGIDIRLYTTDTGLISQYAGVYMDNNGSTDYSDIKNISIPGMLKGLARVGLYKDAPYILKDTFTYMTGEINRTVLQLSEEEAASLAAAETAAEAPAAEETEAAADEEEWDDEEAVDVDETYSASMEEAPAEEEEGWDEEETENYDDEALTYWDDPDDLGSGERLLGEYSDLDPDFYFRLTMEDPISVNDSWKAAFRFYHLWGLHFGFDWNADMDYASYNDEAPVDTEALRGDFVLLEEYLSQMDALGILDDATIIVTADHGHPDENQTLQVRDARMPLILVKRAGADRSQPMQVNGAPVSHEDFEASVMDAFGLDASAYGTPFWGWPEDSDRVRYYYYTAHRTDLEGEIGLREYEIAGDARDFANWKLTGNDVDILYSLRKVATENLSDQK